MGISAAYKPCFHSSWVQHCSTDPLRLSKTAQGIFNSGISLLHAIGLMIAFKAAIKQVMYAPISFFETTVRSSIFCFILSVYPMP